MPSLRSDDPVVRWGRLGHAVGAACALAAAGLVWLIVYRPLVASSQDVQLRLNDSLHLIHDSHDIRKQYETVQADFERSNRDLADLRSRIPDTSAESDFLLAVTRMSDQVSVQVQEFYAGRTDELPLCKQLEVRMKCRGTYASVCRFLAGLKELPRLCRIKTVKIAQDNGGEGLYSIDLILAIYFGLQADSSDSKPPATSLNREPTASAEPLLSLHRLLRGRGWPGAVPTGSPEERPDAHHRRTALIRGFASCSSPGHPFMGIRERGHSASQVEI